MHAIDETFARRQNGTSDNKRREKIVQGNVENVKLMIPYKKKKRRREKEHHHFCKQFCKPWNVDSVKEFSRRMVDSLAR